MANKSITLKEINSVLDELKEAINNEMDGSASEDTLSLTKMRRLSIERAALKKLGNVFNQIFIEEKK